MRTRFWWSGMAAAGLVVWGCVANKDGASGSIRGRVLGLNGQPASNVRVMLDRASGGSALTTATGEFQLGHAGSGVHQLLVFDAVAQAGATVTVQVGGSALLDVGDVNLLPCAVAASGAVNPGGPNQPGPSPAPSGTPIPPCGGNPPPPPPNLIHYDQLTADEASGFVDQSGIYGFGEDDTQGVGFEFFVPGQLGTAGSATVHVAGGSAGPNLTGSMSLFVWDTTNGFGWLYLLQSGDLSVTVSDDDSSPTPGPTPGPSPLPPNGGPGYPTPAWGELLHFDFKGVNLSFDYVDWSTGGIDPTHLATVGTATASGEAWEYLPPPQPTGDVTIANFVASTLNLFECAGCVANGPVGPPVPASDMLFIYAYDSTDQADLTLTLPVTDLALPGTAAIDWSNAWGEATYYGGANHAQWSYYLSSALLASASSAVTVGQPLDLHLSNGVFDYLGSDGCDPVTGLPCVQNGGSGGGTVVSPTPAPTFTPPPQPTPSGTPVPPPVQYHLYIGSANLSSTVESCAVPTGSPGPTPVGSPSPYPTLSPGGNGP